MSTPEYLAKARAFMAAHAARPRTEAPLMPGHNHTSVSTVDAPHVSIPTTPCWRCKFTKWCLRSDGVWVCGICHPSPEMSRPIWSAKEAKKAKEGSQPPNSAGMAEGDPHVNDAFPDRPETRDGESLPDCIRQAKLFADELAGLEQGKFNAAIACLRHWRPDRARVHLEAIAHPRARATLERLIAMVEAF